MAEELILSHEEKGTGIPLVLVHGFPFDHTIWWQQLDEVSDAARVVAVDLPGFGGSPLPPPQPALDDYVEALRRWADSLGLGRFVLVGHSMGGYVALNFVRHYGDRLLGLGLVCTRAGPDTEQARQNRLKQIDAVWERGAPAIVDAMLPNLFSPATKEKQPEVVEQLREIMLRPTPGAIVSALWAMAGRPDATDVLGTIKVPTVVVSGADDAIIPAPESDLLAASIVGAVQERIPGAGHMPMLEQPDRLNAVLRDLARGARPAPEIPDVPDPGDIEGVRRQPD